MAQAIIDVSHNLPYLQDSVHKLTDKLGDLTPLMDAIGSILEGSTRQRFAYKTDPDGTRWANLLPSTHATKGNNNILVDSGNLLQSITHHATSDSVTIGTAEIYGAYHQFGTQQMTPRPFLGLSDEDKTEIDTLINEFLTDDET